MKGFEKKDKRSSAEKEYEEAMKVLKTCVPGTDEYKAQFDICEKLHAMVVEDKKQSMAGKLSPDTIATCVTSTAGVLICAYRDYLHPITTKALGLIMKGRVR